MDYLEKERAFCFTFVVDGKGSCNVRIFFKSYKRAVSETGSILRRKV